MRVVRVPSHPLFWKPGIIQNSYFYFFFQFWTPHARAPVGLELWPCALQKEQYPDTSSVFSSVGWPFVVQYYIHGLLLWPIYDASLREAGITCVWLAALVPFSFDSQGVARDEALQRLHARASSSPKGLAYVECTKCDSRHRSDPT